LVPSFLPVRIERNSAAKTLLVASVTASRAVSRKRHLVKSDRTIHIEKDAPVSWQIGCGILFCQRDVWSMI